MFAYTLIEEDLYIPDLGPYRTYGICVRNESGETVTVLSDISTDRDMVSDLAERCTKGELAPEHLLDVVLGSI